MISFDFAYHKPDTLKEAMECREKSKEALYYGGGTEIISMARAESLRFDAVIDIKNISECNVLAEEDGCLIIGSGVTLTRIAESGCFPLLCKTVSRIADHTIQGKITIGGNLAGSIIYREAALPLMLTNCRARVMTREGLVELPFAQIFNGRLRLGHDDFLAQLVIDKTDAGLPHNHVKKTKMDKIDYPLITMAANKKDGIIRAAVSGAGETPIRLSQELLNDTSMTEDGRISEIIGQMSGFIISDIHGGKEYRAFVLRNILLQMYENFRGV